MVDSKPDQQAVLGQVSGDSRKLLATIDNLIDLSQIETRELVTETIDIAAVAQEARNSVGTAAQERGLFIALDVGTGADQTDVGQTGAGQTLAIGDRWAARRILDNLLANAVRSTPPGSTVSLSVDHGRARVTASVRHTGSPLPQDLEQSFRDDLSAKGARAVSASDIGLALSSHLARLMSGRLIVENVPKHGTTVTLSLPAA
jgi:two-component system cell cycle sensor histidine kinase PleC